jgi:hypothetical protein
LAFASDESSEVFHDQSLLVDLGHNSWWRLGGKIPEEDEVWGETPEAADVFLDFQPSKFFQPLYLSLSADSVKNNRSAVCCTVTSHIT